MVIEPTKEYTTQHQYGEKGILVGKVTVKQPQSDGQTRQQIKINTHNCDDNIDGLPSSAVERTAFNRVVVGSIPTDGVFFCRPDHHSNSFQYRKASNTTSPRCTSDRFAVGTCGSSNGYRVYTAKEEECPFAKPEYISTYYGVLPALCTLVVNDTISGSLMDSDSWCLDGESLKVTDRVKAEGKDVGGVCARVKCGDDGVVMVMYAGNNEWHNCTQGGFIMPSNSSSFVSGKIKCPKFNEVCTMTPNGGSRLVPKTSREGQESTANVTHSQGGKREQQGAGVKQSTLRDRKRLRNLKTGNNSSVRVRGTTNRTNKEH
ncbi:Peptidase M8 [Trypanosoma melophagium]|uniref:Peptidase M8 n=1 Tax=Trypanosoma melophagium TaxID=715481 RepID=UPI003519E324|nr:Peptidase M8 [Trypanosoma melophagium]